MIIGLFHGDFPSNVHCKSCHVSHFISLYRYAKVGQDERSEWRKFTRDYFVNRGTLANVLLLIDASIPPQQIDVDCANWLGESQVPFSIVFTKTDKRKKKAPPVQANISKFQEMLLSDWEFLPACFATSARTGAGKDALLQYIAQLRELFVVGINQ